MVVRVRVPLAARNGLLTEKSRPFFLYHPALWRRKTFNKTKKKAILARDINLCAIFAKKLTKQIIHKTI